MVPFKSMTALEHIRTLIAFGKDAASRGHGDRRASKTRCDGDARDYPRFIERNLQKISFGALERRREV